MTTAKIKDKEISYESVNALLSIFNDQSTKLSIKEEEIDVVISKIDLYKTIVENALDKIELLSPTTPYYHSSSWVLKKTDYKRVNPEEIENLRTIKDIDALGNRHLSKGEVVSIFSDMKITPIVSIVLWHNDRFSINLEKKDSLDEPFYLKIQPRIINNTPEKKDYAQNYDAVTIKGNELLVKDRLENNTDTNQGPINLRDIYVDDYAKKNPTILSQVNSLTDLNNVLVYTCHNTVSGSCTNLTPFNTTELIGLLKKYDTRAEGIDGEKVVKNWDSLSPEERKRALFLYKKEDEDLKVLFRQIKNIILGTIPTIIRECDLNIFRKMTISHVQKAYRSFGFHVADLVIDLDNLSKKSDIYKTAIQKLQDMVRRSLEIENTCPNFIIQNKLGATLYTDAPVAERDIETKALQLRNRILKKIEHPLCNSVRNMICSEQEPEMPVVNPKIQHTLSALLNSKLPSRTELLQITDVEEIEEENITKRVCRIKGFSSRDISLTACLTEGVNLYNFIDVDRYAIATIVSNKIRSILLIDDLSNFLRNAELFLVSYSRLTLDNFIDNNSLSRDDRPVISVHNFPEYGNFSNGLMTSKENSENNFTSMINVLRIVPFCGVDASQFGYYLSTSRTAPGARNGPIDYGSQEVVRASIRQKIVDSFWKGIRRMQKNGKSFKLSPYGGNDIIEFKQDRIIFEDQVLHATNIMIAPTDKIYNYAKNKPIDIRCYHRKPKITPRVYRHLVKENAGFLKEYSDYIDIPDVKDLTSDIRGDRSWEVGNFRQGIVAYHERMESMKSYAREKIDDLLPQRQPNYDYMIDGVRRPLSIMFWNKQHDGKYARELNRSLSNIQTILIAGNVEKSYRGSTSCNIGELCYYEYNKDPESPDWSKKQTIHGPDDLDFNTLVDRFVETMCLPFTVTKSGYDLYKDFISEQLPLDEVITVVKSIIGTVECNISVKVSGGNRTSRWMVNGKNVRRDEILSIAKRAMCFNAQKEYDDFIAQVSRISLRSRDLMAKGLSVNIRQVNGSSNVPVLLEFGKKGAKWQLIVRSPDGKVYHRHNIKGGVAKYANQLANSEKAKRLGSSKQSTISSNTFVNMMQSVEDFGLNSTRRLFATGLHVIDERIARSRLLLENAVNMVGAEYVTHTFGGKTLSGYKVVGVSGKSYIVCCDKASGKTSTTNDHGDKKFGAVYALPTLQYVCIVDKSHDQSGYDIIVNRLLALKNDQHVAGSVTTLSKYIK